MSDEVQMRLRAMDEATMERVLDRALERQPAVSVPQDFAKRVCVALPQRRVRRRVSVSRIAAMVAMTALAVGLFAVAPHARPSLMSWGFDAELLMLVEMAGVAFVLTRKAM